MVTRSGQYGLIKKKYHITLEENVQKGLETVRKVLKTGFSSSLQSECLQKEDFIPGSLIRTWRSTKINARPS